MLSILFCTIQAMIIAEINRHLHNCTHLYIIFLSRSSMLHAWKVTQCDVETDNISWEVFLPLLRHHRPKRTLSDRPRWSNGSWSDVCWVSAQPESIFIFNQTSVSQSATVNHLHLRNWMVDFGEKFLVYQIPGEHLATYKRQIISMKFRNIKVTKLDVI